MATHPIHALAIHVCADVETTGLRSWPPPVGSRDTLERAQRICELAGIAEQHTLAGDQATAAALRDALAFAAATLRDDGLLVVSFAGHTERGEGPIDTAQWCLVGGGVTLAQLAADLARLPRDARIAIVADTCYAAAITAVLHGPQPAVVIAGCDEDQTMIERARSEFVVRLEDFMRSGPPAGSPPGALDALRDMLEADTPDCERPVVWTNATAPWPDRVIAARQ
jgi:hypothetical protein